MAATREKIPRPLRFEIEAPLAMGLSKGATWLGQPVDHLLWLRFSVCPAKFPDRQTIYLVPKGAERSETTGWIRYNSKKWRRLTPEIEGSLQISVRPLGSPSRETQADAAPLLVDPSGADLHSNTAEEAGDATKPAIGKLGHGPEFSHSEYGHAEFYSIELNLPENEFDRIRDAFLIGKQPSAITIWTPDVEHGLAPDGSDIVWEVWDEHATFATIVGFSMAFSTDLPRVGMGPKKTENEEENEREETAKLKEAILHSREDIQLLCYQQAALNSSVAGLRMQVYILIAVAIVIAIIAALH